ncbi:putative protein phosphatase 2C 8 [Panicum miliaceum]|uniref:protein-serine/threonine phosphatase n=1 Tax=Panicum miliaceum TaxID=4540 RepID=A0A3L6SQY3_PANMI|nr:putative protein phosphatase 2C 8 [Panicum miliaceum]
MGLDYFAVVDGRHLGAAAAERLPARLGNAIAEQVEGELLSENPRFLLGASARRRSSRWSWRRSSSVSKPELYVVAVQRKDRDEFLILASGGLWGAVSTESACAFVRRRLGEKTPRVAEPWEAPPVDAGASPTLLARELAEKVVHAGSQDNVSVAIVLFTDFWAQFERAPTSDERSALKHIS